MKIMDFIEAVKKNPTKANEVCAKIVKTKYIPVLEKRQLAELVYENSIDIENGVVKVDSLSKYLIFTLLMLNSYTELEFTVDENGAATEAAIQEYDALCKEGLINKIIAEFQEDYARANEIMNYVFQDNLAVNNTVEAVVGRAANGLLGIIGELADKLGTKIEEMELDLADFDLSKFNDVINLLNRNQ